MYLRDAGYCCCGIHPYLSFATINSKKPFTLGRETASILPTIYFHLTAGQVPLLLQFGNTSEEVSQASLRGNKSSALKT